MIGNWLDFIMQQKFGGASPNIFGAKNMQNFGRYFASSDFEREYLRNGSRYPKRKANFSRSIPLVFNKKSPANFLVH